MKRYSGQDNRVVLQNNKAIEVQKLNISIDGV